MLASLLRQGEGIPGEYLVPEPAFPRVDSLINLPAVQRRKVMVRLGRLIRRCLADPQRTGSGEHGDDPIEHTVQREDPTSPS